MLHPTFPQLQTSYRTLLACIKFLAQCPCPRCLVPKAKVGDLGTKADRRRRDRDARQDSHGQRSKIKMVRDWLYVQGTNIASVFVRRVLGPESLTATKVLPFFQNHRLYHF
jgi:uncharacterized protein (DUF3084 family)